MEERTRFTEEELAIAKSADLCAVAEYLNYTIRRVGKYHTLKEMDSIRIYNRKSWCRWSRQQDQKEFGGSQIDFLCQFAGMEVKEAVFWLLDFVGYCRDADIEPKRIVKQAEKQKTEKKLFILPARSYSNQYLYSYLEQERCISREVIEFFVKAELIYEERCHHNIVFKGNNKEGKTLFASMRGVSDHDGYSFKCDVAGNDKNYGFHVWNDNSQELVVFEAAIDLMSYVDIYYDFESNKLALGMVSDAPLLTFLQEHPQISSIRFCLDNDEPGRVATEVLMQKYYEKGYEVEDCPPPRNCKDYNQWLQEAKRQRQESEQRKSMVH